MSCRYFLNMLFLMICGELSVTQMEFPFHHGSGAATINIASSRDKDCHAMGEMAEAKPTP